MSHGERNCWQSGVVMSLLGVAIIAYGYLVQKPNPTLATAEV